MYGQRVSRSFKDISLSFDPHPVTKDLPVLKNENAIRRSVRNLVQTIPGERFFNSILGIKVALLERVFKDNLTPGAIIPPIYVLLTKTSNVVAVPKSRII